MDSWTKAISAFFMYIIGIVIFLLIIVVTVLVAVVYFLKKAGLR